MRSGSSRSPARRCTPRTTVSTVISGASLLDHGHLPLAAVEALERQAIVRGDDGAGPGSSIPSTLAFLAQARLGNGDGDGDAALDAALLDRLEEMDLGDSIGRDLLGDGDEKALAGLGEELGHRATALPAGIIARAASSRST